jgi:hypothetical protein
MQYRFLSTLIDIYGQTWVLMRDKRIAGTNTIVDIVYVADDWISSSA